MAYEFYDWPGIRGAASSSGWRWKRPVRITSTSPVTQLMNAAARLPSWLFWSGPTSRIRRLRRRS